MCFINSCKTLILLFSFYLQHSILKLGIIIFRSMCHLLLFKMKTSLLDLPDKPSFDFSALWSIYTFSSQVLEISLMRYLKYYFSSWCFYLQYQSSSYSFPSWSACLCSFQSMSKWMLGNHWKLSCPSMATVMSHGATSPLAYKASAPTEKNVLVNSPQLGNRLFSVPTNHS